MASFNMIIPELPKFLSELGGGQHKGWIIGFFALAALLSRPFSGRLSDIWGRIPVMVIGAVVAALCGFIYLFVSTLWMFFALRFLHGLSTGFNPTGTMAYLSDITPPGRRGEWLGYLGVASSMGMASGPALGSFITEVYSREVMFICSSLLALLALLFVAGMRESLLKTHNTGPRDVWIRPSQILEPAVLIPSIAMFFSVLCFGVVLTITPDYGDSLGVKNKGLFFTVMLTSSIVIRLIAGKASDRMGRVYALRIGMSLLLLSMTSLTMIQNHWGYYAGAILYGLASGISSPAIFAWTIDLAHPENRGRAVSTMYIALEAGIFTGSILAGWIYADSLLRIHYTYLAGLISSACALAVLLKASNKNRQNDDLPA